MVRFQDRWVQFILDIKITYNYCRTCIVIGLVAIVILAVCAAVIYALAKKNSSDSKLTTYNGTIMTQASLADCAACVQIDNGISIISLPSLTSVILPDLKRTPYDGIFLSLNTALTVVSFASLVYIGGDIEIFGNSLTSISLPTLTRVLGRLVVYSEVNLPSLALPALTSIGQVENSSYLMPWVGP